MDFKDIIKKINIKEKKGKEIVKILDVYFKGFSLVVELSNGEKLKSNDITI